MQRIRLPGRVLDVADDVLNNVGTFILLHRDDDVSLHILRHGQLKEITCMHGVHGSGPDDLKEIRQKYLKDVNDLSKIQIVEDDEVFDPEDPLGESVKLAIINPASTDEGVEVCRFHILKFGFPPTVHMVNKKVEKEKQRKGAGLAVPDSYNSNRLSVFSSNPD